MTTSEASATPTLHNQQAKLQERNGTRRGHSHSAELRLLAHLTTCSLPKAPPNTAKLHTSVDGHPVCNRHPKATAATPQRYPP
mmetsp:Transcript_5641/g.14947  ORF Transcript_5641/g.14947 Transcript_5641/m.14947 type:complete len:83 (-) Transcript_5641:1257-1505(-)